MQSLQNHIYWKLQNAEEMCKKGIQTLFHEYNNCDYGPKIPMNSIILGT